MFTFRYCTMLFAVFFGAAGAQAQVSLTGATPYTQSFDTLANSGSSSVLPAGWLLNESGSSANADGKYTANTGSNNAGDSYSYGAAGTGERAFGTLLSGTLTPSIGACFANNTGGGIQSLTIAYNGEQWRLGQSGRGADHLDFSYRVGSADITSGTWTSVPSLNFLSPITSGSVGALDGNAPANRTAISGTIPGLVIASSQILCVRWSDFNVTGSDDGLAVDDFSLSFTSSGPISPFVCEDGIKTSTAIHTIQGSATISAMSGQTVEVEGIVVGDFRASNQLKGFYLQEPDATWDSDPFTSEGIFIFDNALGLDVNIGDRVRVKGTVDEFSSSGSFLGSNTSSQLTEIGNVQSKLVCSTGNVFARTAVSLPTANAGDLERYEGMAVELAQQLTVTGNFSLGTFDQLDLAPSVLYGPTTSANPASWPGQASLIRRSVIALDDASTLANTSLYPTMFPAGGLSAANTLRVGALVNYDANTATNTPLAGVLDDRFGEYRIQPTSPVTFYNANPRPDIAPILSGVGGRFRAVSANVLNFFTTFGSRGADTQTEFDRQKTKIVEELIAMDGDVFGLGEVQNFANGNTNGGAYTNAALQSLVDGLNCRRAGNLPACTNPPAMPFGFIDTLGLGASNGTDAIRSAIVYRLDRLLPVGGPALYYQNDSNRPSLAQTFQPATGAKAAEQTFTFVVNHFRSKGSACGGTSDDVFQGNCNGLRLNMAQNVVSWLAGNPTSDPAAANRRLLLVGDFNAYYGEDPIQYFAANGYANLVAGIIGPSAYSYNFGSQAGYLDHAMANGAMNLLVKGVAEWHNNADEPSSLQALNSSIKSAAAQTAYYAPDPYAASDHDPIVVGFNPLAGDLNDDGIVGTADQQLLAAAIGKSASAVDRRMDFDGDGRITLNDYRVWTAYYRGYIQ